jgi:hypothetical protein
LVFKKSKTENIKKKKSNSATAPIEHIRQRLRAAARHNDDRDPALRRELRGVHSLVRRARVQKRREHVVAVEVRHRVRQQLLHDKEGPEHDKEHHHRHKQPQPERALLNTVSVPWMIGGGVLLFFCRMKVREKNRRKKKKKEKKRFHERALNRKHQGAKHTHTQARN